MGPYMSRIQHAPTLTRGRQGTVALGHVEEESRQERVVVVPVLELLVISVEDVAAGEAMVELGAAAAVPAAVALAVVVEEGVVGGVAEEVEVVDLREFSTGWRAWCRSDWPCEVDRQNQQVCSRYLAVLI